MSKNIININLGGAMITTLSVPSSATEREIVIFDSTTGHSIGGGHGVLISTGGDITGAQSITFTGETGNPGGSNTIWLNTTDSSLYLGAAKVGSGDVVGPASAADNAITRYDGVTGKLIQNSIVIVGDSGDVSGARSLSLTTQAANPGATNTLWINTTDSSLYLGAAKVGTGNVVGPASATDNALARYDGVTGKLIQESIVIVGDSGDVSGARSLSLTTQAANPGATNTLWLNTSDSSLYLGAAKVGGVGSVVGPASATDDAIVRFDGTTGKLVQNSVVTLGDTGIITYNTTAIMRYFSTQFFRVGDSNNVLLGLAAGDSITVGANNTIIGDNAGTALTNSGGNVFVGKSAGAGSVTGGNQVFIGANAGIAGSNAYNCVAIGASALAVASDLNIAIGSLAMFNGGTNSIAIGYDAGRATSATIPNNCVLVGQNISNRATAVDSVIVGNNAVNLHTGSFLTSVIMGTSILSAASTSAVLENALVGAFQLSKSTGAITENTMVGTRVLVNATSGDTVNNAILGTECLQATTAHGGVKYNTLLGGHILFGKNTTSTTIIEHNIIIGYNAGSLNTSSANCSNNIWIGSPGAASEVSTIRIGSDHTACYLAGVRGVATASPQYVTVGLNGQLGSTTAINATGGNLVDTSTFIVDITDATKRIGFDAAGTTGTTTTLAAAQTVNRALNLPDADDTLVGRATTDTITNKIISGATNYVEANALKTTGGAVVINGSAPPTNGEMLVATSATTASWVTPNLIYPTYGTFNFAFSGSDNATDNFSLDLHFAVHGKLIIMQVTGKDTNFISSNRNFSCTITAGLRPSATMIGTSQISQFIPTYRADTATPEIESDINGLCTVSSSGVLTIWKEAPPGNGTFKTNARGFPPFTMQWLTGI